MTSAIASGSRRRAGVRTFCDPESLGRLRDRRPGGLEASTGGSRRRGHDADEVDPGCRGEGAERRQTEPAAADEDGPHARAAGSPPASREGARRLADLGVILVALADRHQLVHRVEIVDVELAVEVIELVLERATEQPGSRDLDLLAVTVLRDDPDLLAPRDVGDVARDRQAALEVAVVARSTGRSPGSPARRAGPRPR